MLVLPIIVHPNIVGVVGSTSYLKVVGFVGLSKPNRAGTIDDRVAPVMAVTKSPPPHQSIHAVEETPKLGKHRRYPLLFLRKHTKAYYFCQIAHIP